MVGATEQNLLKLFEALVADRLPVVPNVSTKYQGEKLIIY